MVDVYDVRRAPVLSCHCNKCADGQAWSPNSSVDLNVVSALQLIPRR